MRRAAEAEGGCERRSNLFQVNLETDWVNAEISLDGRVVVATSIAFNPVPTGLCTVTLACWDGQTGVERWRRRFQAPNASISQYWGNRGVAISDDGEWVAATIGAWFQEEVPTLVFSSITGELRSSSPPRNVVPTQPFISADGGFVLTTGDGGNARVNLWIDTVQAYQLTGEIRPPFAGDWYLGGASFARSRTSLGVVQDILGLAWASSDLRRNLVAVYDTNQSPFELLSSYVSQPSTRLAVADATIHCHLRLCAAGLWVGDNTSAPSVVVLSADIKTPVFEFATGGSVQSTTLAPGPDAASMYLAAAGCSTPSVCTGPGGNAFLWKLSGILSEEDADDAAS